MILQCLQNFKTQFSQNEEVDSYDNIALNQRNMDDNLRTLFLSDAKVLFGFK